MNDNPALEKSYNFALRIVRLYKYLCDEKHEYILSKQLLTAGTYIGAYIKAAQETESKAAFTRDMQTALQYVSRTDYWLQPLRDGEFLEPKSFPSICRPRGTAATDNLHPDDRHRPQARRLTNTILHPSFLTLIRRAECHELFPT